jgi:ribosome biogenesis protein MAK21
LDISIAHLAMAKNTGRKSDNAESGSSKPQAGPAGGSKISDELRKAVQELGGDDEDLQLIEGIDDDEEGDVLKSSRDKGKAKARGNDEVS